MLLEWSDARSRYGRAKITGIKEYYTNMNPEISSGAVGIPREYGVRVGMEF